MPPQTTPEAATASAGPDDAVPLREGAPCPHCGAEVEALEFLSLPPVAIKREMYDVCAIDTDDLPTPWRHPTAIVYHEDPDPYEGSRSPSTPLDD